MKGIRKRLLAVLFAFCMILPLFAACGGETGEYDESGNVRLDIANLYLNDLGDAYTGYVEDKFSVRISPKVYSWADWDSQVTSAVNGDNIPDVFHWNLESMVYPTLERWAKGGSLRAIPDDMSAYPNIKKVLDSATAVDKMKVNGKLYCIPLMYDINKPDMGYSSFTYVYRKDWAKALAEKNPSEYGDLYKEDDVYTFSEFERLLAAFDKEDMAGSNKTIPLADVEWAFPSVINYFKDAPHAYVKNAQTGKFEWNYTTANFTQGLEKAKSFVDKGYYWADSYAANEGDAMNKYKSGVVGCYFDNFTLTNYSELRKSFASSNPSVDLNEGTALMRLKRDDGKFVYEEANNWWSATLFSADITDAQMNKYFEIMDWLLSEEGTMFATYGFEGTDYTLKEDGSVELHWSKKADGEYANKLIGAKYLRYSICLNQDITGNDPLIDEGTKAAHAAWIEDIEAQIENGEVKLLPMYTDMNWLSLPNKNANANLVNLAGDAIIQYVFGDGGWDEFNENNREKYEAVVNEVNAALGL